MNYAVLEAAGGDPTENIQMCCVRSGEQPGSALQSMSVTDENVHQVSLLLIEIIKRPVLQCHFLLLFGIQTLNTLLFHEFRPY